MDTNGERRGFLSGSAWILIVLASILATGLLVPPAPAQAADEDLAASRTVVGNNTLLRSSRGAAVDVAGNVYITNRRSFLSGTTSITKFGADADGDVAPISQLSGADTKLDDPAGLTLDDDGNVYVANEGNESVTLYSAADVAAGGDKAPAFIIKGDDTTLDNPQDVALDSSGNLYVTNWNTSTVARWDAATLASMSTGENDVAPDSTIEGAATLLSNPYGLTFHSGSLYVTNQHAASPDLVTGWDATALASAAGGAADQTPTVTIKGASALDNNTGLSLPRELGFSSAGYLYVVNLGVLSSSVTIYQPSDVASGGNVTPVRTITGSETGLSNPRGLAFFDDTLYVANSYNDSFVAFDPFRLTPNVGSVAGTTALTLTGSNLLDATDVTFDGVSGTGLTLNSDTELTVTAPAHAALGLVPVVATIDGFDVPLEREFAYADQPTVVTDAASSVVDESAVLNATVNAQGDATSALGFRYDTDQSVVDGGGGTIAANVSPASVSGSTDTAVSADATGLTPATTYYYRASATNSFGTTHGTTGSFTTLGQPTVVTDAASSVVDESAVLNATVNAQGDATSALGFRYDTDQSVVDGGGGTIAANVSPASVSGSTDTAVSADATGLTPATTYYYRASATNSFGTTHGTTGSFTTLGQPTVVTDAASSVVDESAVLNATVNAQGDATSALGFRYDTDQSVVDGGGGTIAANVSPASVSGSTDTAVSADATGLTPATTYYYRASATNSFGTTHGTTGSFTTLGQPTVVTDAASSVVDESAVLNATVNAQGDATSALGFRYDTDQSVVDGGGGTIAANVSPASVSGSTDTAVSADATGLTPATTYYYRASATNSFGTTHGTTGSFTTLDGPPPMVVTDAASSVVDESAVLNATVNAQGDATSALGFRYDTDQSVVDGGGGTIAANVSPASVSGSTDTAVSADATGLTPATTYYYRASATNSFGTTHGTTGSFTTLGQPTVVTDAASSVVDESAVLNATVNAQGDATSALGFRYDTDQSVVDGGGGTIAANVSPASVSGSTDTAVSADATGLTPATTYYYRASATNSFGTTHGTTGSFTTLGQPTVVTDAASSVVDESAVLNATVNAQGDATSALGFRYDTDQSVVDGGGGTIAANVSPASVSGSTDTAVSADATGLTPATTYYYRASATNSFGTTHGTTGSFTTLGQPTVVTDAASSVVDESAVLNATVNAQGDATSALGFRYDTDQSVVDGGGGTIAANVSPASVSGSTDTAVSADATGLTPATTYYYRASATNSFGTTHGTTGSFTTLGQPTVVTDAASSVVDESAVLNATVNAQGDATSALGFRYDTDQSVVDGGGGTIAANVSPASVSGSTDTAVSADATGLTPATTYYYRASATNSFGTTHGTTGSFTTLGQPTVVTDAASSVVDESAVLNATVNAQGDATSALGFRYDTDQSVVDGGGGTIAANVSPASVSGSTDTAVSADATGLTPATTYYYRASATNSFGTTHGTTGSFTTLDGPPPMVVPPTPTPNSKPGAELFVKAWPRKLTAGERTKLVRSATTNARFTRVKTHCFLFGTKLKGKDKRAVCQIKTQRARATNSKVRIWITPKCSVGLKVRAKLVANETGMNRSKWHRTWRVRNQPRIQCPINGNG